ncbi:hypothetical protein [Maridesulfovibrio ferrireducens]|uniref:hypothetical protein n=1 Tax=Maridesulfovibrio ferrireducens TaxID=246191 RepID=UPI000B820AC6|nr:hypothetical protein [Maridesulfovibrio ferrireducens]
MSINKSENFTKEQWTGIFREAGFGDEDMHRWHIAFEKLHPVVHQQFLEHLHVPENEIKQIREWSKS